MSRPREPIASPPGSATLARPQRATSGPSTLIEARSRRTRSYGASWPSSSGTSMVTVPDVDSMVGSATAGCSIATVQPSSASSWAITCDVEDVRARCVTVVRPGASSAAAISFSALFFAPPTCTVPERGRVCGPSALIRKLSTGSR